MYRSPRTASELSVKLSQNSIETSTSIYSWLILKLEFSGDTKMLPGCQNVTRTPKCCQDNKTPPGCCQDNSKILPGRQGASEILPEGQDAARMARCQQNVTRMPSGRTRTLPGSKPGLASKKVLTLTKWLFQLMNCVVSKCKFCALFYLLLSTHSD